ncbi:HAD hydrolase family protein [Patescibacteria group bacterium]|nr:HAD hydrolase family protein [Patescibacteria group bacterium]MBU1563907.1 HAD hydrolase family protein [Patescibacteria group bacterium]
MKDIKEITKEELDTIKIITFDIDGVIAPVGTIIKETIDEDSIDLYMESKKLSNKFIEDLNKLEKYVRLNFSSGRNILYLKTLTNQIFDKETILQAENGNITWVDNKITHPEYPDEYFNQLRDLKEKIKELKKTDQRIRGFEPKLFILTVHCEEMEEIPNLVKQVAGDDLYCLWTNEGYDIGSKLMSKGKAIEILARAMNISSKQIMTTGNNYNDAEMLQVGIGVTVDPKRVEAEYFINHKPDELGGELLVKFLLEYFEK